MTSGLKSWFVPSASDGSESLNSSCVLFGWLVGSLLGNNADSASLWPVFSHLFHEPDLCSDFQTRESAAENAVFVKVDLSPIIGGQKSVSLVGQESAHSRFGKWLSALDCMPPATRIILQTPTRSLEGVVNCPPK